MVIDDTFSYTTQLSMTFIMLINVKMPTTVGILTFISMINKTFERFKARNFLFLSILVLMSSCKFMLSWVEHEKAYNLSPDQTM